MKATVKVQTWTCTEAVVDVEGRTERECREKALIAGHEAQIGKVGYCTKNKTTILKVTP